MCTISNVMELGNAWKGGSNIRQFLDFHDHVYLNLSENTRKCLNIETDVKYEVLHKAISIVCLGHMLIIITST